MDKIALFKDLVSGRKIPSVRRSSSSYYQELNFEFKTVCYVSTYIYCICLCGYEHEFVSYISDFGEIDEEIYERVLQNILVGKCPHVAGVPEDYVRTSCINALHLAFAVKNNTKAFSAFPFDLNSYSKIYYVERLEDNKLRVERISTFQLWIKKITSMVNSGFDTQEEVNLYYDLTYDEISDALKSNISNSEIHKLLKVDKTSRLIECSELAIFWNRPSVLADMLPDVISKEEHRVIEKITRLCIALQRQKCLNVLIDNGVSQCYDFDQTEFLLDLLITYDAAEAVVPVLEQVKDATESKMSSQSTTEPNSNKLNHLCKFNDRILDFEKDVLVLKVLLQFCDVNYVNVYGYTPLLDLLGRASINTKYPEMQRLRHAVELYIYENSGLAVNAAAVTLALDLDKKIYSSLTEAASVYKTYLSQSKGSCFWQFCGHEKHSLPLTADGKTHALYGHDEDDGCFPFNFYAPLLVESGYRFSDATTTHDFQELLEKVHPMEKIYLQDCFNIPRALGLCCRDSLRKHFKGRQIHQFVEKSKLPKSVSDYILLKPLLKCIPKDLLD